jgi:hypothetical protein
MRPRLPASPMIRVAVLTAAVAASLPVGTAFAQSAARVWPAMKTPPPCTAASTQAWLGLGAGGGHAGAVEVPLEFSNTGRQACTVTGYPRVATYSSAGRLLGKVASRQNGTTPHTVTLRPGQTAHAVLRIVTATTVCHNPVTSASLRITPPGQHAVRSIGLAARVCPGQRTMSVSPIQPGVGVP